MITRLEAWCMHVATILVGGSGLVYAWMRYLATPADPEALIAHPLQPLVQHLHLWTAPLLVFAAGLLWRRHVWAGIRLGVRERRRVGIGLALALLPMVVSGYLLQTAVEPWWRQCWVIVHVSASALWVAGYLVHQISPRAGKEKPEAPRALAAVLVLAALAACRQTSLPAPDVIARIEGTAVRYSEFERYLRENSGGGGELGTEVLPALFDRFLDERLLARAAADQGLMPAGTPAREAMAALLASAAPPEPPAAEIAAYYQDHLGEFTRPERVHLRQVFTIDRAAAERAAAELGSGRSFAAVARSMSREPAAERGGDQGELARGDLPPALADVVFKLRPGEISELVQAEYGFHIFQVVERLPATVLSAEEAAPAARAALVRAHEDRQLAALVAALRSRYNVEIYAYNLPFPYRGQYGAAGAR